MSRRSRLGLTLAFLLALILAVWQLGEALLTTSKAWLAPVLISQAWEGRDATGASRPWPWADFTPVARLSVPHLGVERMVLDSPSARALAFGPVELVQPTGSALFGHRDTHFRFLKDLQAGDEITLQRKDGTTRRYRVAATEVTTADALHMASGDRFMTLVTCYPFDTPVPGGDGRFLVHAEQLSGDDPGQASGMISAMASTASRMR